MDPFVLFIDRMFQARKYLKKRISAEPRLNALAEVRRVRSLTTMVEAVP
jgi:uncharacterized protein YneF (UPF0154 family)